MTGLIKDEHVCLVKKKKGHIGKHGLKKSTLGRNPLHLKSPCRRSCACQNKQTTNLACLNRVSSKERQSVGCSSVSSDLQIIQEGWALVKGQSSMGSFSRTFLLARLLACVWQKRRTEPTSLQARTSHRAEREVGPLILLTNPRFNSVS